MASILLKINIAFPISCGGTTAVEGLLLWGTHVFKSTLFQTHCFCLSKYKHHVVAYTPLLCTLISTYVPLECLQHATCGNKDFFSFASGCKEEQCFSSLCLCHTLFLCSCSLGTEGISKTSSSMENVKVMNVQGWRSGMCMNAACSISSGG